jgi:hypothetical protein
MVKQIAFIVVLGLPTKPTKGNAEANHKNSGHSGHPRCH